MALPAPSHCFFVLATILLFSCLLPSCMSFMHSVHSVRHRRIVVDEHRDSDSVDGTPCNAISTESMVRLLMHNYSRSISPSNPVAVQVEITIQDINELDVMSNSFTANLWFSAIWHDPRLAFAHYDPCRQNMSFDDSFEKYLWSPNVCLVNTKVTEVHSSPKPNVLLMLLSNGTVWLNYRVRVEAPCEFHLSDFPMDTALCSLVFESYSFNTATVTIDWLRWGAVTFRTADISTTDYELAYTKHYKHVEYYKAGEWYRLTVEIGFRRRYGYYILQVYANLYLNVFLSWIAFCISLKALPARAILSVNTLMSLCLQFGNVVSSLPPVSYVKSIDYFMFACIAFIFASLLEMAFIAYKDKKILLRTLRVSLGMGSLFDLAGIEAEEEEEEAEDDEEIRKRNRRKGRKRSSSLKWLRRNSAMEDMASVDGSTTSDEIQGELLLLSDLLLEEEDMPRVQQYIVHNLLKQQRRAFLARGHRIDQLSFVLFPMAFSLFNLVYWTYYLAKTYDERD